MFYCYTSLQLLQKLHTFNKEISKKSSRVQVTCKDQYIFPSYISLCALIPGWSNRSNFCLRVLKDKYLCKIHQNLTMYYSCKLKLGNGFLIQHFQPIYRNRSLTWYLSRRYVSWSQYEVPGPVCYSHHLKNNKQSITQPTTASIISESEYFVNS